MDDKLHWVRFVIDHIHENCSAVVVTMARIKLREGTGEIVRKHFVLNRQRGTSERRHAPSLIIDASDRTHRLITAAGWRTDAGGRMKLLNVFRKIKNGVSTG